MKAKFGALCIGIILAMIATIFLIVLTGSANLYVAYVFCLLGIICMVTAVFVADVKSIPSTYANIRQAVSFLPLSLIASTIVLILQGTQIFVLPAVWHAVIQVVLLATIGIKLIGIASGKEYIAALDKRIATQRSPISGIANEVDALQEKLKDFPEDKQADAEKALRRLTDMLRYSDPICTEAVAEMDSSIEKQVQVLKTVCSAAEVDTFTAECASICEAVRKRNEHLKSNK